MQIFFVLLHLWIFAGICVPCHAKNLPLIMAATEPTAATVMEGSEFDKAFAVVSAMFEQIVNAPGNRQPSRRDIIWTEGAPADSNERVEHSEDASSYTASPKEPIPHNQYYIKAKDSDFILIDPLDDDDRNAAAISKMVQGSYQNRRRDHQESEVPEPVPLPSRESDDDRSVAATQDSEEQDKEPAHPLVEGDDEEDHGDQEDQGDDEEDPQGDDEDHGDQEHQGDVDEDADAADHQTKDRDNREVDEEDEEDDDAPLEGAPVTEEDLDDIPPETFMPPTVLGVARHYKVGSSFSVFPVHIPNAPEHIELGSGVPSEDNDAGEEEAEYESPREDDETEAPTEDADGDGEEREDMDPNATSSTRYFIVVPSASEDEEEEEETPVSIKKGHRVSEHGENESNWKSEGGDHEDEDAEHDTHNDEDENEGSTERLREGAEKSTSHMAEGGEKKSENLHEAFDQGKLHDDSAGEEEGGEEEEDKYGKKKVEKGFHDKYNFDQRVSRKRFYKNGRNKGDWITSGEDEHSFYNKAEEDEAAIFGKFKDTSVEAISDGGKTAGQSAEKRKKIRHDN